MLKRLFSTIFLMVLAVSASWAIQARMEAMQGAICSYSMEEAGAFVAYGGCMIPDAYNYDPNATFDDGSCLLLTCDYDGPLSYTFTNVDYTGTIDQVIPGAIEITRGSIRGLFNPVTEAQWNGVGPGNTLWKSGPTGSPGSYQGWRNAASNLGNPANLPGQTMSMYLPDQGLYFDVEFHSWSRGPNQGAGGGGFSYTRTLYLSPEGCQLLPYILGCTEPTADNYDPTATVEDGSCIISGCMDPAFCDYNPIANNDTGCTGVCSGCTDMNAYNYDPLANVEDGSCTVLDCVYEGPEVVTYTKANNTNPYTNFDEIFPGIQVTRGVRRVLVNVAAGDIPAQTCCGPPSGVEFKWGVTNGLGGYTDFRSAMIGSGYDRVGYVLNYQFAGTPVFSMYIPAYDSYFDVEFHSWTPSSQGGGFSYTRTFRPEFGGCVEVPLVYGCTDSDAGNFDPAATVDNGSCFYLGCTNPLACEYDITATVDDGSCATYPGDACDDFDATTINDIIQGDCNCAGESILGCTDTNACNYNPIAQIDNGTCAYVIDCNGTCDTYITDACGNCVLPQDACYGGCTIADAYNYDPNAGYDDGSCLLLTCDYDGPLSYTFTNADYTSTVDQVIPGAIEITRGSIRGLYNPVTEGQWNAVGPGNTLWKSGPTGSPGSYQGWRNAASNLGNPANLPGQTMSMYLPDQGLYFDVEFHSWTRGPNQGAGGGGFSYTRTLYLSPEGCQILPYIIGCMNPEADNYDPTATVEDGSCIISGCMDPAFCDYNPNANNDTGCSGVCPGCTDMNAYNYDPLANVEDGSCTVLDCVYEGPEVVTYTKANNTNPYTNFDEIFPGIQVTRGVRRVLVNVAAGDIPAQTCCGPPSGVEFKWGVTDGLGGYTDFRSAMIGSGYDRVGYVLNYQFAGTPVFSMYIPAYDSYFDVEFHSWTPSSQGGGFSYTRTFRPEFGGCVEVPLVYGCTDSDAGNFDPAATVDNGSCFYLGCTNPLACEYDITATVDDGSCATYPGDACDDFDATTVNDLVQPNCICSGESIFGCTDTNACNYNPIAQIDNGTCAYVIDCNGTCATYITDACGNCVLPQDACYGGCTIADAYNYDPNAGYDDGSCLLLTCDYDGPLSYTFTNADYTSTVDQVIPGAIEITRGSIRGLYNPVTEGQWNGVGPGNTLWKSGPTGSPGSYQGWRNAASNLGNPANLPGQTMSMYLPDQGLYFDVEFHSWSRGPNQGAGGGGFSYTRTLYLSPEGCQVLPYILGCTEPTADNYDPTATVEDGTCIISGCLDPAFCDYNPIANNDTGCTGVCPGCMEPSAFNYDPLANVEDGSCTELECIYQGPDVVTYTKTNNSNPYTDFDEIFPDIQVTRGVRRVLVNVAAGDIPAQTCCGPPSGVEFKWGVTDGLGGYTDFRSAMIGSGYDRVGYVLNYQFAGTPVFSMYIPAYDSYFDVEFHSWTPSSQGGGFSYTRTFRPEFGGCIEVPLAYGCTDPLACNYDINAQVDNGSCGYVFDCLGVCGGDAFIDLCGNCVTPGNECIPGCMEALACNYNPAATIDDGSCDYSCYGCTDILACNYDMNATINDGSCVYPGCTDSNACNYDMNAGCDDGSCVFPGCTNVAACNYDMNAGCDDGSCVYPGCTDVAACNYDMNAGCDDGSCVFPGCTNVAACNYDMNAGCDDGSCTYPGCTNANACNYDATAGCDDGSCVYPGCMDVAACNYDMNAGCDNGSCAYPGCNDPAACNYNPAAGCDDGTCYYGCFGCTYSDAINYNPLATEDDGSCIFPYTVGCMDQSACNFNPFALTDDGSCDYSCLGCTNPAALNYNGAATRDDGSCLFAGCTDPGACNYNYLANFDDNSCDYGCQCPEDINGDGTINTADLLDILSVFGQNCN